MWPDLCRRVAVRRKSELCVSVGELEVTLRKIGLAAFEHCLSHGFYLPIKREGQEIRVTVPEKLCLIHAEVSEALEAYRKQDDMNLAEELADVIIRTCELAHSLQIDLDAEVTRKMEINNKREFRHGGKLI